jgi:hypothetical protein
VTQIGHDEVAGSDYPIVGLATGTAIGFVVAGPAAGWVNNRVGRLETDANGGTALHTVRLLVGLVSGDPPRARLGKFSDQQLGLQEGGRQGLSIFATGRLT